MSPLTAEKVADYLPLAGKMPHITGRIINVTHQIPYHISRSSNSVSTIVSDDPAKSTSPPPAAPAATSKEPESPKVEEEEDVNAAPISKLARHHRRGRTLRAKFRAAEWMIVQNRGHGALNSGLQSLNDEYQTLHIGWTGPIKDESNKVVVPSEDLTDEDRTKLKSLLMKTGQIIPVFLGSKSRGHYEGYCKESK
jgi:trehalose-6-phosphate synthase